MTMNSTESCVSDVNANDLEVLDNKLYYCTDASQKKGNP